MQDDVAVVYLAIDFSLEAATRTYGSKPDLNAALERCDFKLEYLLVV